MEKSEDAESVDDMLAESESGGSERVKTVDPFGSNTALHQLMRSDDKSAADAY